MSAFWKSSRFIALILPKMRILSGHTSIFYIIRNMFLLDSSFAALPKVSTGITITRRTERQLLRRFHQQVLQKCFPVEDVQRTARFIADVNEGAYTVILAEEGTAILGGIVIEHFSDSRFMLIAWVAIDEAHRNRNIGTLLVEEALEYAKDNGALYLIGEVENPNVFEEIEPAYGNPWKRARFYSKFDCKKLEVPYVITSYGEEDEPLFDVMLTLFPLSENQRESGQLDDPALADFVEELVGSETEETQTLIEACRGEVKLTPFKEMFF